jgi:hypothetical protein
LDATPWPEVLDLLDYWTDNPPLTRLMTDFMAYMGFEFKDRDEMEEEARPMSNEETQAWVESLKRR